MASSKLPDDFYHLLEDYKSSLRDNQTPRDQILISYAFGFNGKKRSNIHFLAEGLVVSAVGNVLLFTNLKNMSQNHVVFESLGSIGAVAVSPSKTYIAVGEKSSKNPNIYIFEYPSLRLFRVLKGGTEKSYSSISFHPNGKTLASIGGDPDFTLTIWDWKQEAIILRSRAFSQEVFNVKFSATHDGVLTTSGMGHIKFWKMAHTFTGLKLQGQLGKFGLYELSDIDGFVELPDGKILSGSESGNMLLWEGGFIKCEITGKDGNPCHKGTLRICYIQDSELITAGDDGYVRIWDLEAIDSADATAAKKWFEVEAQDELLISSDSKITSLVPYPNSQSEFLVQDETGHLWRFHAKKRISEKLFSFHSGPVTGVDTCPLRHEAVSIGVDGTLRLYDYMDHINVETIKHAVGGTCVYYANKKIDSNGKTLFCGFADGTIRIYSMSNEETLMLSYINKPHSVAVLQIAQHSQGHAFATLSADNQVFIFTIFDGVIKPVGFYLFSKPVLQINWAEDATHFHLNAALSSGEFVQIVLANNHENTLDTRMSFDITKALPTKSYNLDWISNSWHDKALKKLQEEVNAAFYASKKAMEEAGSWNPIVEETKRAELAQQLKDISVERLTATPVATISLTPDQFILAVHLSNGISEIYQCSWKSQGTLLFTLTGKVTFMKLSVSGQFLSVGTADGSSYLLDFVSASPVHSFWSHHLHDLQSGQISGILNSFDDSHLISAGLDGNFFVMRNVSIVLKNDISVENASGTLKHPKAAIADEPIVHSLQESKLKAKSDAEKEEAEASKQRIRFFVKELRQEYIAVTQENLKLPKEHKIDIPGLEVDPNLRERIQIRTKNALEQVNREMAWMSEKVSIGPKKLKRKFLDNIENDFMVVSGLRLDHNVSSFRTIKPDESEQPAEDVNAANNLDTEDAVQEKVPESNSRGSEQAKMESKRSSSNENGKSEENAPATLTKATSDMNSVTFGDSSSRRESEHGANELQGDGKKPKEAVNMSVSDPKNKREVRKQQKLERANMFQELLNSKPDDTYEDPRDVAAIKYALNHMGDYKLKTGDNYIVPAAERIDADKKRRQMVLLKEAIRTLKIEFNEHIFILREAKEKLIKEIGAKNGQIESINSDLISLGETVDSPTWYPNMEESAYPEKRFNVTDEEITIFKQKAKEAEIRVKEEGGFGNFGSSAPEAKPQAPSTGINPQKPAVNNTTVSANLPNSSPKKNMTQIQVEENERRVHELLERRSKIQRYIDNAINEFDQSVNALRREKVLLEGDLISCEMKYILLYREWVLLKEFELNDNLLADKLRQKKTEKKDITAKLNECQEKLFIKKTEVENVIKSGRDIYDEFVKAIGEGNKHEEFLSKVFRRKVKRSRKVKASYKDDGNGKASSLSPTGEDQEEESESEEEDEDYDSDSSESEGNEEFDESCPSDCDATIYNQVLDLRNKRLDQEDILSDIQKIVEVMKKEHESLIKKEKSIDTGLAAADKEIQEFQTQKQQKLNELDVVVSLRLHQLQYLDDNALPKNSSQALVFTDEGLEKLRTRIRELQQEKTDIRKQHKDLKKMHINLVKSKKEKQSKLLELEARAYDVQMLKFGRVIDLEKLERMGVNKTSDELRERIGQEDAVRMKELDKLDDNIYELREKVIALTRDNTQRLEAFVNLNDSQRVLENALNHTQNVMTSEYRGLQKQDMHEMDRLKKYSQEQKEEIERLKQEIHSLVAK